ncbi:MAG: alpha/beta hydrolase [Chloroflexota bacterium]
MQHIFVSIAIFSCLFFLVGCTQPDNENSTDIKTTMNTYIPGKNKITFNSHGETLVGDLYLPPDYQEGKSYPGIIVGGSWTTVKEQMAGLYAERLSQEGYAALAFDHRYYGESTGEPRFLESPEAKTEDFIAAMDYLVRLPVIDGDKTGGMAICASGGYMADAVAQNPHFKAFAMVVPWFNTDEVVHAFYGGDEGINERITNSRNAMSAFQNTGEMQYIPSISDTDPGAAMFGPFEYYLNEDIGNVDNWSDDKFALASWEPWLTYRPVSIAKKIEIPTLLITSEGAATPQADREFYELLQGPKRIEWIEGGQLDFYYQPAQVNASTVIVAEHFATHLQ